MLITKQSFISYRCFKILVSKFSTGLKTLRETLRKQGLPKPEFYYDILVCMSTTSGMHGPQSCDTDARPFQILYYPDGDPIGKPGMIHRQTSFDSVNFTENTRVIRDLPIDDDQ